MEDEKKKKKNKKKKNKQNKTTGDVTHGIGESANANQNHVIEQNHHNQVLESTDVQNDVQKTDVDLDRHHTNGTETSVLAEAEKLYWMDREVGASLEETIKELQKENDSCMQKEASLEETIKQLQNENDTHKQKEASLEMKLLQLQSEKDYWFQKEAVFEEKINQLIDETATLSLKGVSLEEKIKQLERERDSWVQNENSTKETIASLNSDNTRLQAQVMALEESINILSQENQRLTESMFGLQSQIQNLEKRTSTVMTMHASGSEDMNAKMEAAQQLVEKLAVENPELVEKVNELYVELDRRGVTADRSSAVESELTVGTAETVGVPDLMPELSEKTSASGERMDSTDHVVIKDERNGGDNVNPNDTACVADPSDKTSPSGKRMESLEDVAIEAEEEGDQYNNYVKDDSTTEIPNSPEIVDSEEIVQIPLDENEVGDPGLQAMATHDDEKIGVPLTDAPLIGAPFRLISFFARYVSGADLVNKSSAESETINSHN